MKKKIILVTLLSFVLVLSACGQGNEKEGKKLKEVAVKADFVQYDYQKLKE